MSARRATIHDVARRAGVSATTVSHTFSGNGVVATATQQRIRRAATELGYRPDALARGLRSSRLGAIALVERTLMAGNAERVLGIDYFLRFAGAAAIAAADQGFALMFVADPWAADAPSAALACDGFIVTEPVADDPLLIALDGYGIPYVSVGRDPARAIHRPGSVVDIATELITVRALDHLVDGGARRVAVLVGTDRNEWTLDTVTHYRAWAGSRGMSPVVLQEPEADGADGGRRAGAELMAAAPDVDAVYVLTAEHAVGLQSALAERGRDGVLLVCGSDAEALRTAHPPISAVDLQPEALAHEAVMRLLTLIDGVERPAMAPEHARILVRSTSGAGGEHRAAPSHSQQALRITR
ncbi:MAG: LacI family DNA-binding transcriptional regulator [Nocardioides sp.]|uniref:LacI family DNA-binding transcriptional regulator n=1 Tax=Nocardioides sp. TaxID=35761 RepID=UPI0039E69732